LLTRLEACCQNVRPAILPADAKPHNPPPLTGPVEYPTAALPEGQGQGPLQRACPYPPPLHT
jgi:hypothetical protein